jgi:hypothetical protein
MMDDWAPGPIELRILSAHERLASPWSRLGFSRKGECCSSTRETRVSGLPQICLTLGSLIALTLAALLALEPRAQIPYENYAVDSGFALTIGGGAFGLFLVTPIATTFVLPGSPELDSTRGSSPRLTAGRVRQNNWSGSGSITGTSHGRCLWLTRTSGARLRA